MLSVMGLTVGAGCIMPLQASRRCSKTLGSFCEVAQLVEQVTVTHPVAGSIPALTAISCIHSGMMKKNGLGIMLS